MYVSISSARLTIHKLSRSKCTFSAEEARPEFAPAPNLFIKSFVCSISFCCFSHAALSYQYFLEYNRSLQG